MATLKYYLDQRNAKRDGTYSLRLALTHKQKTAYWSVGVHLTAEQWSDIAQRIVKHKQKDALNRFIDDRKSAFSAELMKLIESGETRTMSTTDIKNHIVGILEPKSESRTGAFDKAFRLKIELCASTRTKEIYQQTYNSIASYCIISKLKFEDITPEWLTKYNNHRAKTAHSQNARNIDLRNIRSVFNLAIDKGTTLYYPFRRFKIKPLDTRKRSLSLGAVRELFAWDVKPIQQQYLDVFKLSFYLIGINIKDLLYLKPSDYADGRIHYIRFKGKREYDIKVEPEAKAIIDKYRGKEYLLCFLDNRDSYRTFNSQLNKALQRIGTWTKPDTWNGKWGFEALHSQLSSYWARHSWATIARNDCNISRDDIRLSLGHGQKMVTDIYIREDLERVDRANRMVIDCVLGLGKYASNDVQADASV